MSERVAQLSAKTRTTSPPSYAVRTGDSLKDLPPIDCVSRSVYTNTSSHRLRAATASRTVARRKRDLVDENKRLQADRPNSSVSQKNSSMSGSELNINDSDLYESDEDSDTEDHTDDNTKIYLGACRLFGITPSTTYLKNLTQCRLVLKNHPLGPKGAKAIAVALTTNLHIQNLDLEGNNIGPEGAEYIADMLKENLYITSVAIAENNIGGRGAELVAGMMHGNNVILSLDISGNNLDERDAVHVADILQNNRHLQELNVSYNRFGEKGGQIIGPAIGENVTLTSLSLKWNHLRQRGAIAVAEGIRENIALEKVDLSWNGFGVEGAKAMSEALKDNEIILELDLSANRIVDDALKQLMKGALKNTSLFTLKVGNNPISVKGSLELIKMLYEVDSCPIQELDIVNIPIDGQFSDLLDKIQSRRILQVSPGISTRRARLPSIRKFSIFDLDDPMMVLFEYMKQQQFRLIDLFHTLDDDDSRSLTKEEFRDGLLKVNIPMSERALDRLMEQLDEDDDGEITYGELMKGKRKLNRKVTTMLKPPGAHRRATLSAKDKAELGRLTAKVKAFLQMKRDQAKNEMREKKTAKRILSNGFISATFQIGKK
ncbi:leucine-rich repeat-containing protein 74B-like [Lineus longissimus]|uniref:leucine-rich repeat-containing protein 74B-like n=1 Tax=Lineus longissimus TaxID=88925 RepID=UPI002B4E1555